MASTVLNYLNSYFRHQSSITLSTSQHVGLSIVGTNRIRLIRCSPEIIDIVRETIQANWPRGVEKEKRAGHSYKFKLKGNPWRDIGVESVQSRFLMTSILSVLYHNGWHLLTSSGIIKGLGNKDTLIFQPGVSPTETSFFAVSFNEGDKLRLIDAPSELIAAARQAIGTSIVKREEWIVSLRAYQFKLHGRPWFASRDSEGAIEQIILVLLDHFKSFGWEIYASIFMSNDRVGCDTDTWFLRRINQMTNATNASIDSYH